MSESDPKTPDTEEQEKWDAIDRINLGMDKIEKDWQKFSFVHPRLISRNDLYHEYFSVLWELSCLRAAKKDWWNDEDITGTFADVLTELRPDKPVGRAEKSLWFLSPVTFLLAWVLYVPIALCVSVLALLAQLEGWLTVIIGFTGFVVSGISISSASNSDVLLAAQILGVVTGILTVAGSVDLVKFSVRGADDLTIQALEAMHGKTDGNTVFQRGVIHYSIRIRSSQ